MRCTTTTYGTLSREAANKRMKQEKSATLSARDCWKCWRTASFGLILNWGSDEPES